MAFISNDEGNYFYQEVLANLQVWLTCTGVGNVEIPEGDRTPVYCPDPANSGRYKIDGFVRGDKGAGTYTLTKPLVNVYNYLLETLCEHHGRINWVCRGNRQDPRNYELAMLLINADPGRRGVTNPVREPEGTSARVNTTLDLNFIQHVMLYNLNIVRQAVTNTADANSVTFLPARCEDRCGPARGICQEGLMGLDRAAGYLYDAEVKKTHDYGANWAATTVDPFSYGGDVGPILMLETIAGIRYVVFRREGVVGAPAECAYSDNLGVTWTNVFIGTINNQGAFGADLRGADIYACGTGGYIWVSYNQAGAWATSEAGVETTQQLNAICFDPDTGKGFCVGNANAFLFLDEGSTDWAAVTGPAVGVNLLSVDTNLSGHVFVGTNDGRVFRSIDDGTTWVEIVDLGVGTIPWIEFEPMAEYVGAFVHNTAAPLGGLYRSEDAGASWWQVPGMPANVGLNSGHMCDANNIYVVGNAQGGTTFIARSQPA
jgi:photosystem II stability/assembly factor-like uncharacterized protein